MTRLAERHEIQWGKTGKLDILRAEYSVHPSSSSSHVHDPPESTNTSMLRINVRIPLYFFMNTVFMTSCIIAMLLPLLQVLPHRSSHTDYIVYTFPPFSEMLGFYWD